MRLPAGPTDPTLTEYRRDTCSNRPTALSSWAKPGEQMRCPKCSSRMEPVTYQEITVERCTTCYGLFFGMLEFDDLKAIEDSARIDIGDAAVGRLYDAMRDVTCPACGARMIKMVDSHQPHLTYEACTVCHGVFFDAGEFRDYKEERVLEFFRDLRLMRKRRR